MSTVYHNHIHPQLCLDTGWEKKGAIFRHRCLAFGLGESSMHNRKKKEKDFYVFEDHKTISKNDGVFTVF